MFLVVKTPRKKRKWEEYKNMISHIPRHDRRRNQLMVAAPDRPAP
jgi:hypothetical protein